MSSSSLDALGGETLICRIQSSRQPHCPRQVFDNDGFKAEAGGGEGGEADTEVVGYASEEEAGEASLAKIACQAGGSSLIVFGEGGIAVDVLAEAFAEDEFSVGEREIGMEVSAAGALKAVGAGEGDVVERVPVLGEDDVVEAGGEGVDAGEDGVAVGDGQGAAGEKVQLHVDDK